MAPVSPLPDCWQTLLFLPILIFLLHESVRLYVYMNFICNAMRELLLLVVNQHSRYPTLIKTYLRQEEEQLSITIE